MPVSADNLVRLQSRPELIRNLCILAHVDHGKTSLSDCLLASNGIISQSMQGKIRYLDSRPDEQLRGITMESSAISLYFKVARRPKDVAVKNEPNNDDTPVVNEYLVNLIDSPGHIDFSSEVSTASRLCDGAIVVVDVVEGVCSQTVNVLRQSWVEKLKPILLLNKIDRLVTELKFTPSEAYQHLGKIIEQVNAVVGSFYMGQRMEDDMKWREILEAKSAAAEDSAATLDGQPEDFLERSDDDLYFTPENNNVVFGSAIDGWGFNISQFAAIYERKLGMNRQKLEKVLWGDFFFDAKTKKVVTGKFMRKNGANAAKLARPLFVQLVLEPIWAAYESTVIEKDDEKVVKIAKALDLNLNPRDLKSKDGKSLLTTIFTQWIPMSRAVLLSVIEVLPSPLDAQRERIPLVLANTPSYEKVSKSVSEAMANCDRTGPVTAFVSKVVSVRKDEIPTEKPKKEEPGNGNRGGPGGRLNLEELRLRSQRARELAAAGMAPADSQTTDKSSNYSETPEMDDDDSGNGTSQEVVIGFGRVFSGTLRVGQEVNLLGPRYDPADPQNHCSKLTITGLYLLMGRELVLIDEAPAGTIVGIGGLDGSILKSGTLVGVGSVGPNLASTNNVAAPILRVAVEPVDPTKIPQLELGLKLLNISDPCVQVSVQENGEHILATAGELHLERCINDLKERFAKIDITYSNPVVPYRETFVEERSLQLSGDQQPGSSEVKIDNLVLKFSVYSLGAEVCHYLNSRQADLKKIVTEHSDQSEIRDEFKQGLASLLNETARWKGSVDDIICFGPRRVGPNILFDHSKKLVTRVWADDVAKTKISGGSIHWDENIITGFQNAMAKGPLCAEPMEGVGCVLESIEEVVQEAAAEKEEVSNKASNSGRIMASTRDGIYHAVSTWSPRLMLATYLCDIQATAEVLGKVYGVVSKRRGKIISEEIKEGTPFFSVHASLPVQEAFGFSEEIRKRTSGAANPQLVFSGFQMLDEDPFWVPTTEEELEDIGEKADRDNLALKYVIGLRKRKGLRIQQKLVENAEKQRTMKK